MSKLDAINYYRQSAYYNLKDYKYLRNLQKHYSDDQLFNAIFTVDLDFFFNTTSTDLPLFYEYLTTLEDRNKFLLLFYLSDDNTIDLLVAENELKVSGYKTKNDIQNFNIQYWRDLLPKYRKEIIQKFQKNRKQLSFDKAELHDLYKKIGASDQEQQAISRLYQNKKFFENTNDQPIQRIKTTYAHTVKTTTKTYLLRSAETINIVLENAGRELIQHSTYPLSTNQYAALYKKANSRNRVKLDKYSGFEPPIFPNNRC